MALHLSQLLNLFAFAGVIIPIVIWQVKKSDMPAIEAHGKVVVNWIISWVIYGMICGLLVFVFGLGLILGAILAALMIIFPIIGGIKASSGEVWKYPLSIEFIK